MADNLDPKEINQLLTSNAFKIQQAFRERDEAVFELKGMRNLTCVLQTTRENLHSYKEKSDTYALLLLREESHIKKLKQTVTDKDRQILKLENALKKSGGEIDDDVETDGAVPEPDKPASSKESGYRSSDDENSIYGRPSAEKSSVYGISHEIHDQLLRDYIQLKKELDNIIRTQDINPNKYLEDEEKKALINQLDTSNNELEMKVKQLERNLQEMKDMVKSGPDSSKSKVYELSQQLKSLQEKYHRQEILLQCMEDKCHDLARKLLKLKQSSRTDVKSVEVDSKPESKVHIKSTSSNDTGKADVLRKAGEIELPLDQQVKDLQYQNSALSKRYQTSQQKNEALSEKLKSADKKSQIYEQRYKELLKTLQANKEPCEGCLVKEETIKKLEKEIEQQKDIHGHMTAQVSVYQEDYKHARQEITNLKKKHESEIDQWHRNYSTLSEELEKKKNMLEDQRQQYETLSNELEKMKKCMDDQRQHHQNMLRSRAPPVPEPYHYNRPDEFKRVVDVCDQSVPSNRHQNPTLQRAPCLSDMLECPRCKREFPPSQQMELQIHVNRCMDM